MRHDRVPPYQTADGNYSFKEGVYLGQRVNIFQADLIHCDGRDWVYQYTWRSK